MTASEYKGHLETVQKIVRANNTRVESMPMMGGAIVQVFMSEEVLQRLGHVLDPVTERALRECPYCMAVRNVLGEKYFETSRHYYECFVGEPRTFEIGIRGRF